MLTTALQQSIKIDVNEYLGVKEYAYTCYGDSDSKDTFYVVPEIPVFAKRDTNTPSFMFYKYRSEDTQGGYAQFTVQLPQPNAEMKDRIRLQLYNGLGRKGGPLDKKSKLIVDYIKAKQAYEADPENNTKKTAMDQAQKNTGLSDEQRQQGRRSIPQRTDAGGRCENRTDATALHLGAGHADPRRQR